MAGLQPVTPTIKGTLSLGFCAYGRKGKFCTQQFNAGFDFLSASLSVCSYRQPQTDEYIVNLRFTIFTLKSFAHYNVKYNYSFNIGTDSLYQLSAAISRIPQINKTQSNLKFKPAGWLAPGSVGESSSQPTFAVWGVVRGPVPDKALQIFDEELIGGEASDTERHQDPTSCMGRLVCVQTKLFAYLTVYLSPVWVKTQDYSKQPN